MKRLICAALAVCLAAGLLTGCEKGGEGALKPMGRYVEEEAASLEGVDRVYGLHLDASGNAVFYARSTGNGAPAIERCVLPAGGGTLERAEVPWLTALGSLRGLSETADGTLWAMSGDNVLYRALPGGEPVQVRLSDWDEAQDGASSGMTVTGGSAGVAEVPDAEAPDPEEGADAGDVSAEGGGAVSGFVSSSGGSVVLENPGQRFVSGIQALEDGGVLVGYMDQGVCRYDADGKLLQQYTGSVYSGNLAVYGKTLLMPGSTGKELWGYDLDTGKNGASYTYDNLDFGTCVGLDGEGAYVGDATGIYRQAEGGSVWEKLVDGDLTSLCMPTLSLSGLISDGAGGFLGLLAGQEDIKLQRYVYDAGVPATPDTELTIFGLSDNNTVRQAIGEFQRRNPNVRVNYRVGLDDGSAATAEEVIRALNTELVAGKGPDLLLLDGLSVDSYIEKGVLSDLSGVVDGMDGLMSNLMSAYARDGKIYGVPARFSVPVMLGSPEDVAKIRSLAALAAETAARQGGEPPFLFAPESLWEEGGVIMNWYDACAGVTDGKTVDQGALSGYLSASESLNRVLREHTPQTGNSVATMVVSVSGSSGYEPLNPGAMQLARGEALFHTQELAGRFGLQNILDNLGDKGFAMDTLFGGNAYTPVGGVGIVASGTQQELARSFLEMLLSATVQDNYLYDGFPVNSSSLEKIVNEAADGGGDMGFLALCRGLDTPRVQDQVVRDAVSAQASGLADGSLDAAQAAANVVENTKIYLSE